MSYKNRELRKGSSGFTIIEVLIVLAIAGLILLIVFLAVPALQRSAHNTSAKNDIAGILGGVTEYENNNNGTLPTTPSGSGNALTLGSATACTTAGANCAKVSLGYYDAGSVKIVSSVPGTFPALGNVTIVKGATCSGNAATTTGASSRNVVALYTLEGGAQQCQGS